ncbi:type VI secretion system baseplate subunit TssF [Endozoicomonas arenosclerae]|uniref:type VI secretion system baseplate subunit TssF n=1 Tax=Endozoicomonas arenosclerae TaxID=1633495 RepID=UPI000783A54D|nr:type VI secretion system baseplate subunit TssF [Endozoicomonas arenosclerae]
MTESILPWYERELNFLRSQVYRLSREHPFLAKRLGIRHEGVDDPHMLRLIDSFALCNARLSRQLSEESTQISNNLLQVIFPMALQPLPSASMIRIRPSESVPEVTALPHGTRFRMMNSEDSFCQFKTTSELQLCPFDIVANQLLSPPYSLPLDKIPREASSLLKLDLQMLDPSRTFSSLPDFDSLNVHLQGILKDHATVYDYIARHRCGIQLINEQGQSVELPLSSISPIGFRQNDRMLTRDNTSFVDFQIMMEFLCWPEFFNGFRISNLGNAFQQFDCSSLYLLIFLKDTTDSQEQIMKYVRLLLGCAPVINLFEQVAEPVVDDHTQLNYSLVPDSQSANTIEIQSVLRVLDITEDTPSVLPPMYGLHHNEPHCERFWLYTPRDREYEEYGRLTVIAPELNLDKNETRVFSPLLLCSNGDQPLKLPNNPEIECLDNFSLPSPVKILTRPTAPVLRSFNIKDRLNLLTHLSRNFESMLNFAQLNRPLRSLFTLYNLRQNPTSNTWLDSITSLSAKPKVSSLLIEGRPCFSSGLEVTFTLDHSKLANVSIMMFVNFLDYLANAMSGDQTFLQLVVKFEGQTGEYYRCTRHHGYQISR